MVEVYPPCGKKSKQKAEEKQGGGHRKLLEIWKLKKITFFRKCLSLPPGKSIYIGRGRCRAVAGANNEGKPIKLQPCHLIAADKDLSR
jgi:hypothetical protein